MIDGRPGRFHAVNEDVAERGAELGDVVVREVTSKGLVEVRELGVGCEFVAAGAGWGGGIVPGEGEAIHDGRQKMLWSKI